MKIFIFFPLILLLSSCVLLMREDKYAETSKIETLYEKDEYLTALELPAINKEAVLRTFGTPDEVQKNGSSEEIRYNYRFINPESMFIFLILPIKYGRENDLYHYSFIFKDEKLEAFSLQSKRRNVKGILLIPPAWINKTVFEGINPLKTGNCRREFHAVSGTFPSMSDQAKIRKECWENRLFETGFLQSTVTDRKAYKDGSTKVASSLLIAGDHFKALKTADRVWEQQKAAFLKMDGERIKEPVFAEKAYQSSSLTCRLYSKTGKDYLARNKGDNPYLIFDAYLAYCTTPFAHMAYRLELSNRYPPTMADKINTGREVTDVLDTVKINPSGAGAAQ